MEQGDNAAEGFRDGRGIENHEADHDNEQDQNPVQHRRDFCDGLRKQFFQNEEHGEIQSPQDERPFRAVPETGEHPDGQNIEHPARLGYAVAAHRNVDVVAEPRAEGHMPPPPEFGHGFGNIGVIEVFHKFKAEDPSQTDGHIGVTGEVVVNLERGRNRIAPHAEH